MRLRNAALTYAERGWAVFPCKPGEKARSRTVVRYTGVAGRRANVPGRGHPRLDGGDMTNRTCSIDGCDNARNARGWCSMHYRRWRIEGAPGEAAARVTTGVKTCQVDGCGRTHARRGLCYTHYERKMRGDKDYASVPILSVSEATILRNVANASPIGTTRLTDSGYIIEKVADNDEFASMANQSRNKAWVLQHRLVMARSIDRSLTDLETVHHVNGDRADNRIENLELWASRHPRGTRTADSHCRTCVCGDEP